MRVTYLLSFCIGLLVAGNLYLIFREPEPVQSSVAPVTYQYPENASYFQMGEYHFNEVGEVDGPYNRERARYYYQKAIVDGDTNPLLWYQLGRLDFLDGSYTTAIERFNKQLELHGDTIPNVYYSLGLTYGFRASQTDSEADWRTGAEHFRTFLTYIPDSPWARTDLAWILFALGEYEEMIPVLETGLETHPDHPWLLNMYGLALLNTGRASEAADAFGRSLAEAQQLTVEDWGRAYPGNNPESWQTGLLQFIAAVEKNVELSNAQLLEQ